MVPQVGESREQRFRTVRIESQYGVTVSQFYPVVGSTLGVVMVGGVGGDFDTPAKGLYPRLAGDLQDEGICSLRVEFRVPDDVRESTIDTLAGLTFLHHEGVETVGLIGHSLGGAVVAQAANGYEAVRTVVLLSPQTYGTDPITRLGSKAAVLVMHGKSDDVLSYKGAEGLYQDIEGKKKLVLFEGAGHCLDEVAPEVYQTVKDWILSTLDRGS